MNVIGITLARGGSKSVPKKNIRPILGKPLICYTIEEALKSEMLSEYIVSSDDDEILSISEQAGAHTVKRPDELAKDNTPHLPALMHALEYAEERYGKKYDAVADVRVTNPLKTVEDIDGAIKTLIATDAECVAGVSPSQHPSRIKTIEYDNRGIPRLRDVWPEHRGGMRQDLVSETFIRNGSIYVATVAHLRRGRFFVGVDVVPWMMPRMRSINIDDWVDFWTAAAILENLHG